jgi:hypothetical protein
MLPTKANALQSMGSINGVLIFSAVGFPAQNAPAHALPCLVDQHPVRVQCEHTVSGQGSRSPGTSAASYARKSIGSRTQTETGSNNIQGLHSQPSNAPPNHLSHRGEMYPEVLADLLIRISARGMRPDDYRVVVGDAATHGNAGMIIQQRHKKR